MFVRLPFVLAATAIAGFMSYGAAAPTASCSTEYTVVAGDTCAVIAQKFGVDVNALIAANDPPVNAQCTNLQIGEVLCIPGASTTPPPPPTCSAEYTVVSGDSCDHIAALFGIATSALEAANPSINAQCTNLQIGEVLCIPA